MVARGATSAMTAGVNVRIIKTRRAIYDASEYLRSAFMIKTSAVLISKHIVHHFRGGLAHQCRSCPQYGRLAVQIAYVSRTCKIVFQLRLNVGANFLSSLLRADANLAHV